MQDSVIINPIPRKSAQGRHNYSNPNSGLPMNRNKARYAGTMYSFGLDKNRPGYLRVGFSSRKTANIFKGKKDFNLPTGYDERILDLNEITIQEYLELKWGRPRGYYKDAYKTGESTPLSKFRIFLKDSSNILDLNSEKDDVFYNAIQYDPYFANSLDQRTPEAEFYISHIGEETEKKATKKMLELEANSKMFEILNNASTEVAQKFATILKVIKGNPQLLSRSALQNALTDFITVEDKQVENINKFLELYKLYTSKGKNNPGKIKFENLFIIQMALNLRILFVRRDKYTWGNAPSENLKFLANTTDELLDWLNDPTAETYVKELLAQIKQKQEIEIRDDIL